MFNEITIKKVLNELNKFDPVRNNIEIEVKFGYYVGRNFKSKVPFRNFNTLKNVVSKKLKSTKELTKDYRGKGGIRKQIISKEGKKDRVIWQRKTREMDFSNSPFKDYGVRLSVSTEEDLEIPPEIFVHDILRIKDRTSFLYKGFLKIDMTVVQPQSAESVKSHHGIGLTSENCRQDTEYEVEVEIMNWNIETGKKLIEFNALLKMIYLILYNTTNLYTIYERDTLFKTMNDYLGIGGRSKTQLDFNMVAQARNLKYPDMVWGGLVGNRECIRGKIEDNQYSVTHKADGIRKFLMINTTGIWIVFPPREANLVRRFSEGDKDRELNGLILDGELIPKDRRRKSIGTAITDEKIPGIELYNEKLQGYSGSITSEYWFLVFDVLLVNNNKDVQILPHSERMYEAYEKIKVMNFNENRILTVSFKSFYAIPSVDKFFLVMQRMFSEKTILPYHEDGFIFMSEMAPYNPIRQKEKEEDFKRKLKLRERRLTKFSDICKWKPVERLTIDFSITHRLGGKVNLLVLKGKDKCVPFKGTRNNPFDQDEMVDHDHPMLKKYPTKTVIEFRWDFETGKFVPVQPRLDKLKPNREDIAEDDFSDIFNPITQEVLEGKNFRLMSKYFNRIKRNLFRQTVGTRYLLDIGSGNGADISSWNKFDKILAIEPDPDHIIELKRRLSTNKNLEEKVVILQSGGENVSRITNAVNEMTYGQGVDVVSLMLSMTFFWKNEKMLRNLVRTIDENLKSEGTIIFLTMDGDTVEEVFNPFFRGLPRDKIEEMSDVGKIILISVEGDGIEQDFKPFSDTGPNTNSEEKLIFLKTGKDTGFATLRLQPKSEVRKGNGRKAYISIRDWKTIITSSEGLSSSEMVKQLKYDIPVIQSPTRTTVSLDEFEKAKENEGLEEESVPEQEEYLVHLDDFERILAETRLINSKEIYRADREHFLNKAEKGFAMMYSWGKYTLSQNIIEITEEYALWEKIKELTDYLKEEYGKEVVEAFKRFNVNNIRVFGDLTRVDISSEKFGLILDLFETNLKNNGLKNDSIVHIMDFIESEYPLELDFISKEIEISETDLPGILRIGDYYFYIDPEKLDILLELEPNLLKIAKVILKNYSTTITSNSNLLPKNFIKSISEMWYREYMLEDETTPLTSKVLYLDKRSRKGNYFSYYEDEKSLGSIGSIEKWKIYDVPEELLTNIISFNTPYNINLKESVERYIEMLNLASRGKQLRLILFIPIENVESRNYLHEEIVDSGFMVYETEVKLKNQLYEVYVLESSAYSDINELRDLFEDFGKYEDDDIDIKTLKQYIPENKEIYII